MRQEDLNPPGIVKIAMSLEEELAQKIKEREEMIVKNIMDYARQQGQDLLRVKQHLGPGRFAPWVKANFRFSRKTAYQYIDIASNWEAICHLGLQHKSLRQALSTTLR